MRASVLVALALVACAKDPPPPSAPPTDREFCDKTLSLEATHDEALQGMSSADRAALMKMMTTKCIADSARARKLAPDAWAKCARCIVDAKDGHEADACQSSCNEVDQQVNASASASH